MFEQPCRVLCRIYPARVTSLSHREHVNFSARGSFIKSLFKSFLRPCTKRRQSLFKSAVSSGFNFLFSNLFPPAPQKTNLRPPFPLLEECLEPVDDVRLRCAEGEGFSGGFSGDDGGGGVDLRGVRARVEGGGGDLLGL